MILSMDSQQLSSPTWRPRPAAWRLLRSSRRESPASVGWRHGCGRPCAASYRPSEAEDKEISVGCLSWYMIDMYIYIYVILRSI